MAEEESLEDRPAGPSEEADRGRRQVVALAVTVVGAVALAGRGSGQGWSTILIQVVGVVVVFLFLMKGRKWARWLLIALCAFLGVSNTAVALSYVGTEDPWLPLFAFGVVYLLSAAALLLSRPVKAHMEAQQGVER